MDILNSFDTIKVCTNYRNGESTSDEYSDFMNDLDAVSPVYEEVDGWNCNIDNVKSFEDLPSNAQNYIHYLESLLNRKIKIISIGPERDQIIQL